MTKLAAYNARRQARALPRWKQAADLRAEGRPLIEVGIMLGVCPSRVHYLEQKWHAYRIEQRRAA